MDSLSWTKFIVTMNLLRNLLSNGWTFTNDAYRLELFHEDYGMYKFFNFEQLNNFLNRWYENE